MGSTIKQTGNFYNFYNVCLFIHICNYNSDLRLDRESEHIDNLSDVTNDVKKHNLLNYLLPFAVMDRKTKHPYVMNDLRKTPLHLICHVLFLYICIIPMHSWATTCRE